MILSAPTQSVGLKSCIPSYPKAAGLISQVTDCEKQTNEVSKMNLGECLTDDRLVSYSHRAGTRVDHSQALFTVDDNHHQTDSDRNNTDQVSRAKEQNQPRLRFLDNFKDSDVLFERGNFSYNHPGNKTYRDYIKSLQEKYISSTKSDKVAIVTKVLDYIHMTCGGRFLASTEDSEMGWVEITNESALRKIGQALREKNRKRHHSTES